MFPLIRIATIGDAHALAPTLRQRDIDEVRASTGHDPLTSLTEAFEVSTLSWTAVDDRGPFCMFGVAPAGIPDTGSPWLLGADRLVTEHRLYFLNESRKYIPMMLERYPMLLNYVDARHSDSLTYLRRVGFTVTKLLPEWGVERRPFYRFIKVS